MSDVVRAKLAEALRQHGDSSLATWANERICLCDCMYRVMPPGPDFCDHLADVLLSLEGVTIVAVPEPMDFDPAHDCVGRWASGGYGRIIAYADGYLIDHSGTDIGGVDGARALAAALLAAADAAKAEHHV